MEAVKKISGIAAVIDQDNIDTDQIIPAEFLKITDKKGLGKHLFENWRYNKDGDENPSFVLNLPETEKATILITGDNFGCGSSREHAPWALLDFGIQVVISPSIADIFSNNAIKNGLLPIAVDKNAHRILIKQQAEKIHVNIETCIIECGAHSFQFHIEPFTRYCFLNGMDQMDFLLKHLDKIKEYEDEHFHYLRLKKSN